MDKFKQRLTSFDSFGVHHELKIKKEMTIFKSAFGAIMTLIIYGTGFAYLTYLMVFWY